VEILYLLVPLSVVLVFLVGAVFWFALESGQFDDLEGPALRILADDDRPAGSSAAADRPAGSSFDLGQKRRPIGLYDQSPPVQGSAESQGANHARNV
jgi:cbb3-type cytochrome oxidase maturation protein